MNSRGLAEVYPGLASQLAELIARVKANDDVIERINTRSAGTIERNKTPPVAEQRFNPLANIRAMEILVGAPKFYSHNLTIDHLDTAP